MTEHRAPTWDAPLSHYEREAQELLDRAGAASLDDARSSVAREHAFENWRDLAQFAAKIQTEEALRKFEEAAEAVIAGDLEKLRSLLQAGPGLARARSSRRHRATLLHYVAANGVEEYRQKSPASAAAVARLLLASGAEVDALADMYGGKCSTMNMLLSSCHPASAGVQVSIMEVLLDHGAAINGVPIGSQPPILTALAFGYYAPAKALAARGAAVKDLATAAGLGDLALTRIFYGASDAKRRQIAVALAAQHGHAAIAGYLLEQGEDPSRFNPKGFHSHSTPLHQAALAGHLEVVRVLVEGGARIDLRDAIYQATPLGWAEHGGRTEVAEYLRGLEGGSDTIFR